MLINKKYRICFMAFIVLSISSCSSKMLYNNLDWLTYWYIDDYVNLTDAQEDEFDPFLIQFLDWHRKAELKSYISLLKTIQNDLNSSVIDAQRIDTYTETFHQFWQIILSRLEPGIVKLAYSLNEQQIEQFLTTHEKNNLEKIAEHNQLSQQKRVAARLDKIEERIESVTGNLSESQKRLIAHGNKQLRPTFDEWIIFRRAWATSIQTAYTLKHDKPAFEKAISAIVLHSDSLRSEQLIQDIKFNQRLWVSTLAQLIATLNEKQLQKTNNKLQDTIQDLEALLK